MRRTLAAFLSALLVFCLLMARLRPQVVSYNLGDIATRTIKANRAERYVDNESTERLRTEAGQSVPAVYTRDVNAEARTLKTLTDIIAVAERVRSDNTLTTDADRLHVLRDGLDVELSPTSLRLLISSSSGAIERAQQTAVMLVQAEMRRPIRANTEDLERTRGNIRNQVEYTNLAPRYRELAAELAQIALQPNQLYDETETDKRRAEAMRQVTTVQGQLQPGDVIIKAGEKVTQRHLDMFTALGLIRPRVDYIQALSLLGVLLLLMLALTLFMRSFAPDVYGDDRNFLLVWLTIIVVSGVFSVFWGVSWFDILGVSTVSAAAIFLALVTRPVAAAGAALFLGSLVSLASPGSDAHLLLAATLCALFASHYVQPRESRSSTITRAAILTAFTNVIVLAVISYVYGLPIVAWTVGMIALGGFLGVILAAGVISVIERPLSLTTHLRLLELQNPNEPVLKRLLTEAPGSYQSSVMVANLADPAAAAVGADPVLTRTACMYHDIGKLKRSYFFVENQFGAENPHERLSPHLSALVLMSHVKDGMEMAQEIKLPSVVASVIPQHHGTMLVSFMYQRAQAEAAEGEEIRERDFRYPGPKPQTKENAIIMLADGVEAAARALQDPTPPKIEELVNRLVDSRIADGQLDESPLTFADITIIKRSFLNTLIGMFHQRLAYPDLGRPAPVAQPQPAQAAEPPQKAVGNGD